MKKNILVAAVLGGSILLAGCGSAKKAEVEAQPLTLEEGTCLSQAIPNSLGTKTELAEIQKTPGAWKLREVRVFQKMDMKSFPPLTAGFRLIPKKATQPLDNKNNKLEILCIVGKGPMNSKFTTVSSIDAKGNVTKAVQGDVDFADGKYSRSQIDFLDRDGSYEKAVAEARTKNIPHLFFKRNDTEYSTYLQVAVKNESVSMAVGLLSTYTLVK